MKFAVIDDDLSDSYMIKNYVKSRASVRIFTTREDFDHGVYDIVFADIIMPKTHDIPVDFLNSIKSRVVVMSWSDLILMQCNRLKYDTVNKSDIENFINKELE